MPFIKLEAGKVSKKQKEVLIREFTRIASETLAIPEQSFFVLIAEHDTDDWGVGGKVLTQIYEERARRDI